MTIVSTRQPVIDPPGKWLGIVVFVLGVVLLLAVFGFAYRDLVASGDASAVAQLLSIPAVLVFKGTLLFVMGVVASAIANKGIALYQAARYLTHEETA